MTQIDQPKSGRALNIVWFLFFAIASSAYCVSSASKLSATYDEPYYVSEGLRIWRGGGYDLMMKWGTSPLPINICTMGLYFVERFNGHRLDAITDAGLHRLLPWARATQLIFWWMLLGYAWASAKKIAGPWAARIAVAAIACEPTHLAHAALATTDIAITATMLAFTYHFANTRDAVGFTKRRLVPGVWYGVALLSKVSALVFGVITMIGVEIDRFLKNPPPPEERKKHFWAFTHDARWIVFIGFVLMFVYVGSDWESEPTFIRWAQSLPPGKFHDVMYGLSTNLKIFTNAGEGVIQQIKHNIRGHGAYLLGHVALRSFWYYFPLALTIKLNESLLLAPILALIFARKKMINWACISAGLLLVFSLNSKVQIGIRMMLPLIAIAIVGLSCAAAAKLEEVSGRARAIGISIIVILIGWSALASARVWPNALCYTNDLWGGTPGGYKLLSDSNYDWGQGLFELEDWAKKHGEKQIDVWVLSADPALDRQIFRVDPVHKLLDPSPGALKKHFEGKLLAAGTTFVYGSYTNPSGTIQAAGKFLRGCTPVDRTATFLIYDFRSNQPTASNDQPKK